MKISDISARKAVIKYILIFHQKDKAGVLRRRIRRYDTEFKAQQAKAKLERKGVKDIRFVAPVQFLIGFDEAQGEDRSVASAPMELQDYPSTTKIID